MFENAHALRLVDFTRVRIRLLRPGTSTVALDTTVNFPSAADSLVVPLSVALQGTVAEQFDLTLAMINAAGDTVFRGGPTRVTAEVGQVGGPPQDVAIVYVGVGANAAGVRFLTVPAWAAPRGSRCRMARWSAGWPGAAPGPAPSPPRSAPRPPPER